MPAVAIVAHHAVHLVAQSSPDEIVGSLLILAGLLGVPIGGFLAIAGKRTDRPTWRSWGVRVLVGGLICWVPILGFLVFAMFVGA